MNVKVKFKFNNLNVKLSGIKNCFEVTLNLSSNLIGDSNGETDIPH